jgi:carboxymethylenebutenolidase
VKAPTLTFIGTEDRIPVSGVEAMHAAFDEAGIENEFVVYDGAQHAFFNDTRPDSFDAEAAEDAWPRTLMWFRNHLGNTT